MSIQQVAASEEFATDPAPDEVASPDNNTSRPDNTPRPNDTNSRSSATKSRKPANLESSVQSSLDLVGQGIQSLLSDSLASAESKRSNEVISLTQRFETLVEQNDSLQRTNEEQRKVIVALVRKVTALENHATTAAQHHQRTEKRLRALEQPADLDSEWKDLLDSKGKSNESAADSAADSAA